MKMKASALLINPTRLADLKANYFAYLDAAIADVQNAKTTNVATWFGALGTAERTTLEDGLQKLKAVAQSYRVSGSARLSERSIEWSQVSGTDLHSENQYAAAYAYGVHDINKHFALRIYSGFLLSKQSYDWVVNTMYHELSHRVLATEDVKHTATGDEPAYGQVHVKALAANDTAAALRNASNWAYYINACNGQTDLPF